MCDSDVAFKKLFKVAGTRQIDRQWKGRLKSFVFSNLHRQVKTSQGTDVNTAMKKAGFSVRLASNLKTKSPKAFLSRLAHVLREQRKKQSKTIVFEAAETG